MVGEEKERLRADLDPVTIGEYSGFKALEVARIGYRSNMNALFACAVLSSRVQVIDELQKLINQKIKNKNSDILKDINKKSDKFKETQKQLLCNPIEKTEMMVSLVNTASHQYCHYRHYLGYLDSNINANLRDIQEIERKI
jgi:flagellar biosynthesis chaperone FliJ